MQISKFPYMFKFHIKKKIFWKFRILSPENYQVTHPLGLRNVCLQTYRNNRIREKVAYFLRKIQTLLVNNSKILRTKKTKFSGYYFNLKTNIWEDFQICISVLLKYTTLRKIPVTEPIKIFFFWHIYDFLVTELKISLIFYVMIIMMSAFCHGVGNIKLFILQKKYLQA